MKEVVGGGEKEIAVVAATEGAAAGVELGNGLSGGGSEGGLCRSHTQRIQRMPFWTAIGTCSCFPLHSAWTVHPHPTQHHHAPRAPRCGALHEVDGVLKIAFNT